MELSLPHSENLPKAPDMYECMDRAAMVGQEERCRDGMPLETLLQSARTAISILPKMPTGCFGGYLLWTLEQPPAAIRLVFPQSITNLHLGTEAV